MTFTLEQTPDGVDLVVTGSWTAGARSALEAGDADGLVLNYARGFHSPDLSFLKGLDVRRLNILDRSITDLSAIYGLGDGLESLIVQSDPRATIELDRFPQLTALGASWEQVVGSIRFSSGLQWLGILGYPERDFAPLASLTSLTRLGVGEPYIRSLDGIEDMPWLAELLVNAKNLEDISALERASSPVLISLDLESCRSIPNIEPVASCLALQKINISGLGHIPSLAPLANLTALEWVHMWGSNDTIVDGDLSPIATLPNLSDLRMTSRPHYSPTVKDIQAAIESRR